MNFFSDFELSTIKTRRGSIRYRKAGKGPALLMLHGNPQTHAMWHKVAPKLVDKFTVICPDIPGYGKSFKPNITENHKPYSKVNMASDIINFMELLDFDKFYILAHDRGARIAHRLALNYSEKVIKMILLDIIPTIEHFERTNMEFAMGYYHWFWLAQRNPVPESVINKAPEEWFFAHTSREKKDKDFFHPMALSDYLECIKNPETMIDHLEFEHLKIDKLKQEVRLNNQKLSLSTTEFEALLIFAENCGEILNRDFLVEKLRGISWQSYDRSVDVLVSRLRSKLNKLDPKSEYIKTIHGVGYKFIDRIKK